MSQQINSFFPATMKINGEDLRVTPDPNNPATPAFNNRSIAWVSLPYENNIWWLRISTADEPRMYTFDIQSPSDYNQIGNFQNLPKFIQVIQKLLHGWSKLPKASDGLTSDKHATSVMHNPIRSIYGEQPRPWNEIGSIVTDVMLAAHKDAGVSAEQAAITKQQIDQDTAAREKAKAERAASHTHHPTAIEEMGKTSRIKTEDKNWKPEEIDPKADHVAQRKAAYDAKNQGSGSGKSTQGSRQGRSGYKGGRGGPSP